MPTLTFPADNHVVNDLLHTQHHNNIADILAALAGVAPGASLTAFTRTPDWLNVVTQFGADPTGVVDSAPAIQAAVNAAPAGQVVYFPQGLYSVATNIVLRPGVRCKGPHGSGPGHMSSSTNGAVLQPTSGFAASGGAPAAVLTLGDSQAIHIYDMWINGSSLNPANIVAGINATGQAESVVIESVGIYNVTGSGIVTAQGGINNKNPDGWRVIHSLVQSAGQEGFHWTGSDGTFHNIHCQNCGGASQLYDAFFCGGFNSVYVNCRGDVSQNGFTYDARGPGAGYLDSTMLIGWGSQRNRCNGLNVINSAGNSGSDPLIVLGGPFDGDGTHGGAGGGGYASIAVAGRNDVTVIGAHVNIGTVDVAGGSPVYAVATAHGAGGAGSPLVRLAACTLGGTGDSFGNVIFDGAGNNGIYVDPSCVIYQGTSSGETSISNLTPVGGQTDAWTAPDLGYIAQAFDGAMVNSTGTSLPLGTLNLIGVEVRQPRTAVKGRLYVNTGGSGLTTALIGLYDSGGNLRGSASQTSGGTALTTALASAGIVDVTWTQQSAGSLYLSPGLYYVAILVAGTTAPQAGRSNNITPSLINGTTGPAGTRYGTIGSALTSLTNPFTPGSVTQAATSWWAAVY